MKETKQTEDYSHLCSISFPTQGTKVTYVKGCNHILYIGGIFFIMEYKEILGLFFFMEVITWTM